jgi:hypothetical protein
MSWQNKHFTQTPGGNNCSVVLLKGVHVLGAMNAHFQTKKEGGY